MTEYSTEDDIKAVLDRLAQDIGAIHDPTLGRDCLHAFAMRQRALGARMVISVATSAIADWDWAKDK